MTIEHTSQCITLHCMHTSHVLHMSCTWPNSSGHAASIHLSELDTMPSKMPKVHCTRMYSCHLQLHPSLYALLSSKVSLPFQVCTEFLEAHPEQKVAKTRLHAKVKEIAERAKDHWIIQPQALQDAGQAGCPSVTCFPTFATGLFNKCNVQSLHDSATGQVANSADPNACAYLLLRY